MTEFNKSGEYILVVCPNPSVDIFAWVSDFNVAGVNRIMQEKHFPGGKGIHVALAAAEMGESVRLLGLWGGPTGAWLKNECEKYPGVKCFGPEVQGWSRSCYTFKSGGNFDDTELLGVGPQISEKNIEDFCQLFDALLPMSKAVVMSGSWPAGAPPNGYARLVEKSNAKAKASFLDCTGVQFENAIKYQPYAVHLNKSEANALYEVQDAMEGALKLSNYCHHAAVTDGAKGLYLAQGKSIVHASCTINKIHSAVGSGDCLTAGLAVGYIKNYDLKEMAKLGVACGAANCMREDLGLLFRSDVDQLFKEAIASMKE